MLKEKLTQIRNLLRLSLVCSTTSFSFSEGLPSWETFLLQPRSTDQLIFCSLNQ